MNYFQFKNSILTSKPIDWIYDDDLSLYVNKFDIAISILLDKEEESQEYNEDWISVYQVKGSYVKKFYLRYNGIKLETFHTISVDGSNMFIPCPKKDPLSITKEQYTIGKIINRINRNYSFDDYLKIAGIKVIG